MMDGLTSRLRAIASYVAERMTAGLPIATGDIGDDVLVVVDGVGGFQFAVLAVRRALRMCGSSLATVMFKWQLGPPGQIFTDLMWLRRNRLIGCRFARRLRGLRRAHPHARIHVLAVSGGAGIAVFACERLAGRRVVETLVLACPALSPRYNLGPALRAVRRAYALVSERDRVILGLGTRILGTTDRRFVAAAGQVGFHTPDDASPADRRAYDRLGQVRWSPALRAIGCYGGHPGFLAVGFLRVHLLPLLAGTPGLQVHTGAIDESAATTPAPVALHGPGDDPSGGCTGERA